MPLKKDPKGGKAPPAKKEGPGGGKAKKKWSKGKARDKLNNMVFFDQGGYEKLYKEIPVYKLTTPSILSEKLKIRFSLAKAAIKELQEKGLVKPVVHHHGQWAYARVSRDSILIECLSSVS